ncbi:aspartate carbamoyltransferase catalytic subunit [Corynebacterium tapiri]|uniref:Aspartate carbamoyltransferase n=1 Tax=Corynebacterium tapiri TaxID=1448266 RepID=A0A5C4U6V6_9CORY|nr:aspartate carbamoyltransferase catalytic subunit [Corynebacterium tapiri]TNL99852.1 aspartate carbamoyltransferase catalytic subunit [Corynebacterium tapiri]
MKHFIDASRLSKDEINYLITESENFRSALEGREIQKLPTLRGRTVVTLFYENSTRTRVSFERAAKMLSADTMNVSASSSSVQKGESLRDTGLTLKALGADAIVIRHPLSGAPDQLARWVAPNGDGPSVINGGDGAHQHPTQALLDAVTMTRHLGDMAGKKVLIVGDCKHSRVVRSNVQMLTTLGAEVVLVAPPTLIPVGAETWPSRISHNFDAELSDADVVMMLRIQKERMNGGYFPSLREYTSLFGLTKERHAKLSKQSLVMHPGPMNRGVEIDYPVADAPNSVILEQVHNGILSRMAVLFATLVGEDS